ncbi:MFS transporter [Rubinisphaera margarita]|uniref:MFS transporter n=1 Tax=Rubinisphaera margarita TaxID=2909586 RepID=UPI001EE96485|nr:MFS transporter [Rubinisphaera margarita]MCG6156774.1 MFS transporter [Rubinisphaera margarita]
MSQNETATGLPLPPPAVLRQTDAVVDAHEEKAKWELRNLLVLAAHHVLLRLAWIFKTETVIIPAFLDTIAGAGWIRGCLPVLNRISQSVAPVLASASLRNAPLKSRMLMNTSMLMAFLFGVLAFLCLNLGREPMPWLPVVFLILYAMFFATTGVNQLSFNTLQGKLIRPHRRGRLMSLAGMAGSLVAMAGAWFFLADWLALPDGRGFARIFGVTSLCFLLSSFLLWFVHEPRGERGQAESHPGRLFRNVWRTLREQRSMQRVAVVAMLFMSTMLLFPHYQWLGRSVLNAGPRDLMIWVILQNLSVGVFSWITGYIGDRYGYRIVIRCETFAMALVPLVALTLSEVLEPDQRIWYAITFLMLGLTPVTIKTMFNYVLELVHEEHHPHYLSTLNVCMAAPLFLAPVVGYLIDWNHHVIFVVISGVVLLSGVLTFRMDEPRLELDNSRSEA